MAIMDYESPGLTEIEFEDNIFVTTGLDSDENKKIIDYIERRGGIIKESITKSTDYLIYMSGGKETAKYKKAVGLVQKDGLNITILSRNTFNHLAYMHYMTPGITSLDCIEFEHHTFATTALNEKHDKWIKDYIVHRGGIIQDPVDLETTDYLIYAYGEEETPEYKTALELVQEKGLDIKIISMKAFATMRLMSYETQGVKDISVKNKQYVITGFDQSKSKEILTCIEKLGGTAADCVTEETDYLIYEDYEYDTDEYLKAVALAEIGGSRITILSYYTFSELLSQMK